MSTRELVDRYIRNVEHALGQIKAGGDVEGEKVREVIRLAECYLDDAVRFLREGKTRTSLIAISYSEGLLDALRILGLVKFEWLAR